MQSGNFYGQPTYIIGNALVRLEFLAQAGPRLVRLFVPGIDGNLLAETPDLKFDTRFGNFCLFGGHRLWLSPEILDRTVQPDNDGVKVEEIYGGVKLVGPGNPHTHIQKTIEITLRPDRPGLKLVHRLENQGVWPIEAAPWAITQLRLGGKVFLPQPTGSIDANSLLPNRNLVMWPYSRWSDPRLQLSDRFITVDGAAAETPFKLGYFNHAGWLGCRWEDVSFIKRFTPRPGVTHADYNCNTEVYVYDRFIELETLGPLQWIETGKSIEHTEEWEIYTDSAQAEQAFQGD
jgi:hypothetical protein